MRLFDRFFKHPRPKEVRKAVDDVWADVAELASTPEGVAMMEAARDDYANHEE